VPRLDLSTFVASVQIDQNIERVHLPGNYNGLTIEYSYTSPVPISRFTASLVGLVKVYYGIARLGLH
jgi:hypothetical protein